jgi:hypothetical protein
MSCKTSAEFVWLSGMEVFMFTCAKGTLLGLSLELLQLSAADRIVSCSVYLQASNGQKVRNMTLLDFFFKTVIERFKQCFSTLFSSLDCLQAQRLKTSVTYVLCVLA